MIFSNDELHIILKPRNVKICEHSSFLNINEIVFYIKLSEISKVVKLNKPVDQLKVFKHLQ